MKKLFILLLVLCLAFAGVISYVAYVPMPIAEEAAEEIPAYDGEEAQTAEEAAPAEPAYKGLDYEAILALHGEDEVVATLNGRDVTWQEYFYWLYMQASQADSIYVYYGMTPDWNAEAADGLSLSQLCVENAEYVLRQVDAIEKFSAENGIELTEEDKAAIAAEIENEKLNLLGEEGDDEAFNAKLQELHMSRELYDRILNAGALMERGFTQLYGENGELAEAADVVAYLEENQYMSAHHILFMTIDPATGMKLEEEQVKEKLAQAQSVYEELIAIEDDAERLERFDALKAELCEDTGKVAYPDGYTYTPGTMYPEFEAACLAQEAYQVSEPVETGAGYHLVMTLPLDADATVFTSGQPGSARVMYSEAAFNAGIAEAIEGIELEKAEGFEEINLADFVLA